MDNPVTVLIADDHPIFRRGLMDTIAQANRFRVIEEVDNGQKAWQGIIKHHPRIALLDIDMPEMTGLEVAEKVQSDDLETRVVILTSYKEESFFNRAMDLGVQGYILKENAITDLVNGLVAVSLGETFLSPSISSFLLKRARKQEQAQTENAGLDELTPTELRVLHLVGENMTSKEIAKKLFISPRTVDTHRNNISGKLGLRGSRGLLLFALDHRDELRSFKLFRGD